MPIFINIYNLYAWLNQVKKLQKIIRTSSEPSSCRMAGYGQGNFRFEPCSEKNSVFFVLVPAFTGGGMRPDICFMYVNICELVFCAVLMQKNFGVEKDSF